MCFIVYNELPKFKNYEENNQIIRATQARHSSENLNKSDQMLILVQPCCCILQTSTHTRDGIYKYSRRPSSRRHTPRWPAKYNQNHLSFFFSWLRVVARVSWWFLLGTSFVMRVGWLSERVAQFIAPCVHGSSSAMCTREQQCHVYTGPAVPWPCTHEELR